MKINFKHDNSTERDVQTGDMLVLKDITQENEELHYMLFICSSNMSKNDAYLIDIEDMDVVYPFEKYIAPWDYEYNFSMINAILLELDFQLVRVIQNSKLELMVNN